MRDPVGLRLFAAVVQEPPADAERPAADPHLGLPAGLDLRCRAGQQMCDVRWVAGRADGDDGGDLGDAFGGGEHGGAAEGVPDQQLGSAPPFPEVVGGGDQVLDRRAEGGVGELARGLAQTGQVEAEHTDAPAGQAAGDPGGGVAVLAAGEAVREQRDRCRVTVGEVQPPGQGDPGSRN